MVRETSALIHTALAAGYARSYGSEQYAPSFRLSDEYVHEINVCVALTRPTRPWRANKLQTLPANEGD